MYHKICVFSRNEYNKMYCIYYAHSDTMKVMFPQHIKKWFFSGAAFSILGFSVSFIQLIILAIWIVFALGIFSAFNNSGSKWVGLVLAIIIFIIFLIIAFFNISELNLLAFISKKIKDSFLDVTKKFQVNYTKHNPTEIAIEKAKQEKWKQRIEIKWDLDIEKLSQIDKWWIL